MADITRDLNIINNNWMGHEIRMPIYRCLDALQEQMNNQDAGIEEDSVPANNQEVSNSAG